MNPDSSEEAVFELGALRLDLLFESCPALDGERLRALLAAYDAELRDSEVTDVSEPDSDDGALLLRVSGHTVLVCVVDEPLLEAVVEPCIQLAHYDDDDKDRARAHRAVVSIHYVGTCDPPFVAQVVLAAIGGAIAVSGAIAVVNQRARTSVPVGLIAKSQERMIEALLALPPLLIHSGFAKYVVEGTKGVWMRTHGNAAAEMSDFAYHAESHEEGQAIFTLFSDMMLYLRSSRVAMAPGDVAQIGEDLFTFLRAPTADEAFVDQDDGPVLVVELLDREKLGALRSENVESGLGLPEPPIESDGDRKS